MHSRFRNIALLVPLAALVAAAFSAFVSSEPPPVAAAPKVEGAECRWADSPIVLDCKDDDAAWKNAQVIDNFQ